MCQFMDTDTQPSNAATPPAFDPTKAKPFSGLESRCTLREARAEDRDDPFDALTIDRGLQVAWYEREDCGSDPHGIEGHATYTYLPAFLVEDAEEALTVLLSHAVARRRCVALLGLCFAAGVVTIEQAACVIGTDIATTRRLVRRAFAARLIDIGFEPIAGSYKKRFHRTTTMLRLNSGAHHKTYLDQLTPVERLSILGAAPWPDSTARSERHDVHALEFALRVAEFTDNSGIVGERFATQRLMLGPPIKGQEKLRHGGPDFCFLRGDGARILVEHTASDGSPLGRKVARLVELLAAHDDLIVLFVIATDATNDPHAESKAMRRIGAAIDTATRAHPGYSGNRTLSRVAVIRWRDYFPAPGLVHPDFNRLVAFRRTLPPPGPVVPGADAMCEKWETVSLLSVDELPTPHLTPAPLHDWCDTIGGLGQTPHWLRGTTSADVLPSHLGSKLDPTICVALQLPAGTTARWRAAAPGDRGRAFTVSSPATPPSPLYQYATARLSPWNPYDPFELPPCPLHNRGLSLRKLADAHLLALSSDRYFDREDDLYGMTTLLSILACAKDPIEGKFLRLTSIHAVLAAQYQWSSARAHTTLKTAEAILEEPIQESASIGWLLDPRSDGRRPLALLIAVKDLGVVPTDIPWELPQLG